MPMWAGYHSCYPKEGGVCCGNVPCTCCPAGFFGTWIVPCACCPCPSCLWMPHFPFCCLPVCRGVARLPLLLPPGESRRRRDYSSPRKIRVAAAVESRVGSIRPRSAASVSATRKRARSSSAAGTSPERLYTRRVRSDPPRLRRGSSVKRTIYASWPRRRGSTLRPCRGYDADLRPWPRRGYDANHVAPASTRPTQVRRIHRGEPARRLGARHHRVLHARRLLLADAPARAFVLLRPGVILKEEPASSRSLVSDTPFSNKTSDTRPYLSKNTRRRSQRRGGCVDAVTRIRVVVAARPRRGSTS